ncbi:glycoside hydrolase family 3 protein [Rhodohalobacter sp. SW132]|uniref:glycoside hydrolase family 3 protein n=2 Tax=Rhodohalobacter sp. SW132 TaxID=2293433 RepID=UPI0013157E51|nr:glycoside hydrolase family 3 protein [Rhodohalobacter sp. SW132]
MFNSIRHSHMTLCTAAFICLVTIQTGCINQESNSEEFSIEQKAAQLLMVGFKGFEMSDTSHVKRDIEEYGVGGVILFDFDVPTGTPERNIKSADQVEQLNRSLQEISSIPLLIAVDQEGGRVARLKAARGFPATVSAEYLGDLNNPDSTRAYTIEQTELLANIGFNVNFAPVVDLNTNPENPVIGQLDRSYSADPDIVTTHASIVIEEHQNQNLLPVIKHFPGHGSAWNDSHVGMADVTDTWEEIELEPYRNLSQTDFRFAVMTAHVMNSNLDEELPATLSRNVQTGLLRDDIGFRGMLFSDDMQMDAIRSFYGLEFSIEHALNAGVDMLIFANNSVYQPDIVPDAVKIIVDLVETGAVSEERINEAYERVMETKRQLGLLD